MVESAPSPVSFNSASTERESTSDLDSSNLLNRPEAVIFILIATLLVLWDTYLELLDEVGSASLSARQLARRLGTTQKVIRSRKRQNDFTEWTKSLDPEGIAWEYAPGGIYTPHQE
jgi:hypothetical protein